MLEVIELARTNDRRRFAIVENGKAIAFAFAKTDAPKAVKNA